MTTTRTTTVQLPSGKVATRSSKSKTYTHAVMLKEAMTASELVAGYRAEIAAQPDSAQIVHYYTTRADGAARHLAKYGEDIWSVWRWSETLAAATKEANRLRNKGARVELVAVTVA